jgi:hypothetical protein
MQSILIYQAFSTMLTKYVTKSSFIMDYKMFICQRYCNYICHCICISCWKFPLFNSVYHTISDAIYNALLFPCWGMPYLRLLRNWLLTTKAQVQSGTNSCEIRGERSVTEAGYSPRFFGFPANNQSTLAP